MTLGFTGTAAAAHSAAAAASSSSSNSRSGGLDGGFASLASESLPSLGITPSRPLWKRSVTELAAANQSLVGRNPSQLPPQPTSDAQLLLGRRTDFSSLGAMGAAAAATARGGKAGKASSSGLKSALAMEGGIEAMLRSHRDGILVGVLKKEREETQRRLNEAVDRQLAEDWEIERTWWKQELVGNRNLSDATNVLGWKGAAGTGAAAATSAGRGRSRTENLLVADYGTDTTIGSDRAGRITSGACDPRVIQDHLTTVKQIEPSSDPMLAVAKFEKVAFLDQANGGYQVSWQLLGCMLPNMQNPISGALGSMVHLCRQYQNIISNRVKSASLNGQDVSTSIRYGSRMAETVAAYVKLVSGSTPGLWEIVYYCLRCGDANAGKLILDESPVGQENFLEQPILYQVLDLLSQRQGRASCIFEVGVPMVPAQDRETLLNFYERAKNVEASNNFKIDVLALLCGQQLSSFSTIEDYLFGRMWLALQDREDPVLRIAEIGASIRKYGPEYFGADESGGWAYALPLIASQQFKTALAYLAGAGGDNALLQAVHLGLVFSLAGVEVADLQHTTTPTPTMKRSSSEESELVNALLVSYSNMLQREPTAGVLVALQYLLKIRSKEKLMQEVASLLFRSPNQVEAIAGSLNDVGERCNSELDKHLPDQEVSAILGYAADMFRRQASDRGKVELSASLYMRAYRYTMLIQFLNQLISPTNVSDADKEHWATQSQWFYNSYLAKRTLVLESLERGGNMDLVFTNQTLLEFRAFFDRHRRGMIEEAFAIASRTELLPLSQDDLNAKSSKFKDLDPILKEAFPVLLTSAVECLCEMHRRLKSESRGVSPTVEARLKELQFLARILFIFAGLINMPTTCKNDIASLRANMI